MDEVSEVSDELMERYLEGDEITHEEIVDALKEGTNHGKIFPVVCGVATRNLGTNEPARRDRRGPALAGQARLAAGRRGRAAAERGRASCSPTSSRPGPTRSPAGSTCCASSRACCGPTASVLNTRAHAKERIGQLLLFAGKDVGHAEEFGPGDIGARREAEGHARRRLARGARRADRRCPADAARSR